MTIPCKAEGADPDDWFAFPGSARNRAAKTLCMHCPLYWACMERGLEEGIPYGIFGGLDEKDRAHIWKRNGGRPTLFDQAIDAATRPLLQERRDMERISLEAS